MKFDQMPTHEIRPNANTIIRPNACAPLSSGIANIIGKLITKLTF